MTKAKSASKEKKNQCKFYVKTNIFEEKEHIPLYVGGMCLFQNKKQTQITMIFRLLRIELTRMAKMQTGARYLVISR